jgi:hypothetical protein
MNIQFLQAEEDSNGRFTNAMAKGQRILLGTLTLLLFFSTFETRGAAQEPSDKAATSLASVRPCPADSANSKPARETKKKGKSAAAGSTAAPPACVEVRASALDIQEFFQSFVRGQSWRIGEEKIAEDAWTFSRYLDKDELLHFSNEGPFAGRVNWTEGKALIQVRTRELEKGFTRVEVTARFQGYGQNMDRFAPPKDLWQLESNGTLEENLILALESHLKTLH